MEHIYNTRINTTHIMRMRNQWDHIIEIFNVNDEPEFETYGNATLFYSTILRADIIFSIADKFHQR